MELAIFSYMLFSSDLKNQSSILVSLAVFVPLDHSEIVENHRQSIRVMVKLKYYEAESNILHFFLTQTFYENSNRVIMRVGYPYLRRLFFPVEKTVGGRRVWTP
jgi:hypothetical protein